MISFLSAVYVALAVAPLANTDITGTVTDSTTGQAIQSADIRLSAVTGGVVTNTLTDAIGRITLHNVAPGSYVDAVRMLGFRAITRPLTITAAPPPALQIVMTPVGVD